MKTLNKNSFIGTNFGRQIISWFNEAAENYCHHYDGHIPQTLRNRLIPEKFSIDQYTNNN